MSDPVSPVNEDEAARVLRLLRQHGWNASSFQTLKAGFRYFFVGTDACVAYVDTGAAWVAAGAPIASPRRLRAAAHAFVAAASAAGRRARFFGVESRFTEVTALRALLIGEQPVWDPAAWARTSAGAARIRSQLRRGARKGVTVRTVTAAELADPASPLRGQLEGLVEKWLAGKPLAPMGFVVDLQPFFLGDERRTHVAVSGDSVVGFLTAVPIYERQGWLFEDLLRHPNAPNGTSELLIDHAMRVAAAEGSRYVTLGLAPLAGEVSGWLGVARRFAASLYDFSGLHTFREKLRPNRWDPIYLSLPGPARGVGARVRETVAIYDVLSAFAGGRLVGFGIETLLRGPAFVVRLLGLLLLPWTLLLGIFGGRFFPQTSAGFAVRAAWVAFDVGLAGALIALAARWRRSLGIGVAVAVTVDAVVTAAEVALCHVPRAHDPVAVALYLIAIGAPSFACVVLWHAVGHRRRKARRPRTA